MVTNHSVSEKRHAIENGDANVVKRATGIKARKAATRANRLPAAAPAA
jgi:hypothetical protein